MNVIGNEFGRGLKRLFLWVISITAYLALAMVFYPRLASESMTELLSGALDRLHPVVRQLFHLDNLLVATGIQAYFSVIFQPAGILICIYACCLGMYTFAGEEKEGTIFYLYALPVSRINIIVRKIVACLLQLLLFILLLGGISLGLCFLMDTSQNLLETAVFLGILCGGFFLVGMFFIFISLAVSFKRTYRPTLTALSIFLITFALGILGKCVSEVRLLVLLSPYHYIDPPEVLSRGIPLIYFVMVLSFSAAIILLSLLIYNRRNFVRKIYV